MVEGPVGTDTEVDEPNEEEALASHEISVEDGDRADIDGAVPSKSDEMPGPRGSRVVTLLWAGIAVLLVAVAVAAVVVYRALPKPNEAPTTAAQAKIDSAAAQVEANPGDVVTRLQLVDAYFQFALYDQALAELDEARSLEPTGAQAAYVEVAYGRVYEMMEDTESAKKHYRASLDLLETFDGLYRLGVLVLEEGDESAAVEYWLKAMDISPGRASLRLEIADVYERQQKYDLALEQIVEAARYLGDDPEVEATLERVRALADQQPSE